MKIPKKVWLKYKNALAAVDQKAAADMQEYLSSLGETDGIPWSAVQYAAALTDVYGEAAGAAACEMYDATAEASGAKVKPAEMAKLPKIGEVAKVVRGAFKNGSEKVVPGAVGRLVKQVGADTTLKNAQRDGAEFAWIPAGDTCAFCLTLASRGWQKISKKSLKNGHAEHIHANCDCAYCVRFDKNTTVEGYEPEKYREMYDNAEGDTPKEKINSMRREAGLNGKTATASNLNSKLGAHIPDEKTRQKIIEQGIEAEKPIFAGGLLGLLAKSMPQKEGWYDVVIHGSAYYVEFFGQVIDVDTLCAIIAQRKDYKKGLPIRLISCYSGSTDDGVARYIANKLHVDVEAPDKNGIIHRDIHGKYTFYSGSKQDVHDGNLIVFHPKEPKVNKDEKGSSRVYY